MTDKLLVVAQRITKSNEIFLGLEGVLFGALLFFSLLAFVRNRARKHGEIL
ncbi:MAG: hypothetical protein ACJ74Z_15935 [Bryobacteraceae bacterium]|jgi:hypothetical protein